MGLILLVRHGQAIVDPGGDGALTELGRVQSRTAGAHLLQQGIVPKAVLAGNLQRQQSTAAAAVARAGWAVPLATDPDWDEFDLTTILAASCGAQEQDRDSQARRVDPLDGAVPRWSSGQHDGDYDETFTQFTSRTEAALERLAAQVRSGGTAVVFSSGGVIAWLATTLIGAGEKQWHSLNRVAVNASVTRILVGKRGVTLASYNEHGYLGRELITYR